MWEVNFSDTAKFNYILWKGMVQWFYNFGSLKGNGKNSKGDYVVASSFDFYTEFQL